MKKEILQELTARGIELKVIHSGRISLYDKSFLVPAHNELRWFRGYVKDELLEGKLKSPREIARKAYALLRYKQALCHSSDGLTAFFAMLGGAPTFEAREVYESALKEFDSRGSEQ